MSNSINICLFLRKQNNFDQVVSSLPGWLLQLRQGFISSMSIMKTLETFLPPIISKVTDFKTFIKYMIYLRHGKEDHMPYINITLVVGAAINAFKVIWNHPMLFDNIVVHLGDFQFIKKFFNVICICCTVNVRYSISM